ncbi:hypothetical protein CPB84DRAFT_1761604 [Gymnopilus junonius]|uniref:Uncharacterized protein n=1 Tax=Gymnopilus junonius TaxID=109634 RepID=A0A9P5P1E6_GYMJU|nr:hypothetical protein CPB84DRAFT_1761604 [Gymnopilus junonius]
MISLFCSLPHHIYDISTSQLLKFLMLLCRYYIRIVLLPYMDFIVRCVLGVAFI